MVSKPPAPDVAAEIEAYAGGLATPVELALLGAGEPDLTAPPSRCCAGSVATCRPGPCRARPRRGPA